MDKVATVRRGSKGVFCALVMASLLLYEPSISCGRTKGRELRMAGPIIAYDGGSGGGTYTLLIRGRWRQFTYSEPIQWRGLRSIDQIYLGSVIAARMKRTRSGYKTTSIEIVGLVNPDIRSIWTTLTGHFQKLAEKDFVAAYADYSQELQQSNPFDGFKAHYSAASFDNQPIIIVQPNPLSRYGIISYGIGLLTYSRSTATVRVNLRHFIPAMPESRDYVLTRSGSRWLVASVSGPN